MSNTREMINNFIKQKRPKLQLAAPTRVEGLFESIWKSLRVDIYVLETYFSIFYLDEDRLEWEMHDEPTQEVLIDTAEGPLKLLVRQETAPSSSLEEQKEPDHNTLESFIQ